MGQRPLPQTLIELYAHALAIEREAFKRFIELERFMRDAGIDHLAEEFERIGREEQEQYEALALGTAERELPEIAPWEYAWHFLGSSVERASAPKSAREALTLALRTQPRAQDLYVDVAQHSSGGRGVCFAA